MIEEVKARRPRERNYPSEGKSRGRKGGEERAKKRDW